MWINVYLFKILHNIMNKFLKTVSVRQLYQNWIKQIHFVVLCGSNKRQKIFKNNEIVKLSIVSCQKGKRKKNCQFNWILQLKKTKNEYKKNIFLLIIRSFEQSNKIEEKKNCRIKLCQITWTEIVENKIRFCTG